VRTENAGTLSRLPGWPLHALLALAAAAAGRRSGGGTVDLLAQLLVLAREGVLFGRWLDGGLVGLLVIAGCREAPKVERGMSPDEVTAILGPPDSRHALEGKDLRAISEAEAIALPPEARWVFAYETDKVRVFFADGAVTGMTRDGVSVLESGP